MEVDVFVMETGRKGWGGGGVVLELFSPSPKPQPPSLPTVGLLPIFGLIGSKMQRGDAARCVFRLNVSFYCVR